MSLNMALSSALSGLHLTARATTVVADNLANAQTEGYGVRILEQGARVTGSSGNGVQIHGISRNVNPAVLQEVRSARSESAQAKDVTEFWRAMEARIGMPDEAGSLVGKIEALELALAQATSFPDSTANLYEVARSAEALAQNVREASSFIAERRDRADATIARDVEKLNANLKEIADLNRNISRQTSLGGEPQALMDVRQRLIDETAEIVPLREIAREHGAVMLLAADGSILVDRTASEFGFTRTVAPDPSETRANGGLSGLTLNGRDVPESSMLYSTGRLGANFEIRDAATVSAQKKLDDLTSTIVESFAGEGADPTLGPNDFGLFELDGLVAIPADRTGISTLLTLTPRINPEDPQDLRKIQSGLEAAVPSPTWENAQLRRLQNVLQDRVALTDTPGPRLTLHEHAAGLLSEISTRRLDAERALTTATVRSEMLAEELATYGVDTDAELSRLLLLEKAYAANARVISTADMMLRTLLEI